MKTLYITDMDGTLLNNESRVSAESAAIISQLSREGALITVATARTPATVVPLLEDTYTTPPAIVITGAALWNRATEVYEDVQTMHIDDVESVLKECVTDGLHPFVYTFRNDRTIDVYHDAYPLSRHEVNFIANRKGTELKYFYEHTPLPDASIGAVILFFAMGDREPIENVARRLRATGRYSVSCYPDNICQGLYLLEIFSTGVTKANAIRRVRERMGVERVVVFGDNLNDLSMFEVADLAVAVDNALPEVKAAADVVIGANTTDAVARFIAEDFRR
jgi:Cof subfamily protein (haloacid dehalogenase superfamily)